jgi:O-antigen/teichoic acid export membrane protein
MTEPREDSHRILSQNRGRLFTKGFWAIADQGLFAVSNFLLSVTLARWLSPQGYGAFTVAFAVFLFLGSIHTALLTEPMIVFGPGRHKGRHPEYLAVLLFGHWGLVALGSLLLALAGGVIGKFGSTALASALLGFALAGPFILLLWFMRRVCAMRLEPHLAASGGVVYLLLIGIGLFELYQHAWLSTLPALGVMGLASLTASLWLAHRLHVPISPPAVTGLAWEALRDHWRYGRWSIASMVLTWIRGDSYYLLLPLWWGLEASAALKAVMNLILPVQHVNTALAIFLVPALVRTRGEAEFGRLTHLAVGLLTAGSLAYLVLLALFHGPVMTWLYGGRYDGYAAVVSMAGLVLLTSSAVSILGAALRALERPHQVFGAYGLATAVGLTVGLWFTVKWGVAGAALGLALASATNATAMWVYYKRSGGSDAALGAAPVVGAAPVL